MAIFYQMDKNVYIGFEFKLFKFSSSHSIVSIGEFEWISISLSKSAAFSLQTSENNLKPP